jgi:hypothetical protein
MKRSRTARLLTALTLTGSVAATGVGIGAGSAFAAQPATQEFFICPSVSVHNAHGMWVMGKHGAYYVLIPTEGATGSKVFLTVPVQVANQAQVPAGWALYADVTGYPNFTTHATNANANDDMVVLLAEGISTWLGSPAGWSEGDMATVADNGEGTYIVTDMTRGESVTIDRAIPLASAAIW